MVRLRKKLIRMGWLCRYWSMDKYADQLRIVAFAGATTMAILMAVWLWVSRPQVATGEVHAIVWWVQLIIMVVAAIVAYALAPKPEPAKPVEGKAPVLSDGKTLPRIYGTEWIDDSGWAGWVNGEPEPIRRKGGKK